MMKRSAIIFFSEEFRRRIGFADWYLVFYFLFLTFYFINIAFAQDSLPPLPDPFDVKLKWTLPQEKLYTIDTIRISLLGGLALPNRNSNICYPLGVKAIVPLTLQNKFFLFYGNYLSDIDYEIFHTYSGRIVSNIPVRASFLSAELAFKRIRRSLSYYEDITTSGWYISPIFLGELNPQFGFRFARFFRHSSHQFLTFTLQNDYIIPTFLGNFDLAAALLTQSHTSFVWFANLSDHIVLNDLIFIKPKVTSWFSDRKLAVGIDFGIRIGKALSIFQFACNNKQLISFDSLYADAGPFRINQALRYPSETWLAKVSIQLGKQEVGLSFRSEENQIHYVQSESLFYPENSNQESKALSLELKNSVLLLNNRIGVKLNSGRLSLLPAFVISDYLTLHSQYLDFSLNNEILGKRHFGNQIIGADFRLSSDLTYHHSFFELTLGVKNILGSSWKVYPNYIDNHRKIFLEFSIINTF